MTSTKLNDQREAVDPIVFVLMNQQQGEIFPEMNTMSKDN